MSANEGDVIKRDELLHFYHLRKSKDPDYYEFKPWDRTSRLILDYPSSLWNWKPNFFFISGSGWSSSLVRTWTKPPSFFVVGKFLCLVCLPCLFSCFSLFLGVTMIGDLLVFLFYSCSASSSEEEVLALCWKRREYLETVKDFDELVSLQSLFLHFLGPKSSTKVWKDLEVVK